jgi:DNA-directed RNA polymerase subunit RPC12/RpoP
MFAYTGAMASRLKRRTSFDFSQACPLCNYRILPAELLRLAAHLIKCPKCGRTFDEMGGRKRLSANKNRLG